MISADERTSGFSSFSIEVSTSITSVTAGASFDESFSSIAVLLSETGVAAADGSRFAAKAGLRRFSASSALFAFAVSVEDFHFLACFYKTLLGQSFSKNTGPGKYMTYKNHIVQYGPNDMHGNQDTDSISTD